MAAPADFPFDPTFSMVVALEVVEERRQQHERWGFTHLRDDNPDHDAARFTRLRAAFKNVLDPTLPEERKRREAVICMAMVMALVERGMRGGKIS